MKKSPPRPIGNLRTTIRKTYGTHVKRPERNAVERKRSGVRTVVSKFFVAKMDRCPFCAEGVAFLHRE